MAVDFTGGAVPCLWIMLYDDDYLSDNRRVPLWPVPFADPPGPVLHSLYPDPPEILGCHRNLSFTAGRGYFNHSRLHMFHSIHEKNCISQYGKRFERQKVIISALTAAN